MCIHIIRRKITTFFSYTQAQDYFFMFFWYFLLRMWKNYRTFAPAKLLYYERNYFSGRQRNAFVPFE